ncbi:adenine nucleotide alpha hydrolases-like protein [Microthyrium microscopicum]|uniref:Adenine nucleotide alpha hydrolases-like protein n=1 Tax=Microthyrium microscopicum TaxID=703497 RepID=A0A6A6UMM1_9PEZI|nr:adenine nucleotide alpha hydrolases-like protein [Microthyrium microscopicum]
MSPPPAPLSSKFDKRVGFDTFDKKNETAASGATAFTLARKHVDYNFTKQSRTFLCGLDSNDYSEYALEWLIDELVDDGDEVVCLRVVDKDSSIAGSTSVEQGLYKEEAERLMESIVKKNSDHKAINLVLEFSVGKVEKVIIKMIKLYEPALLIVGTRGRNLGGIQGLLPGSVSKYCLQNSPIPVIVVRPNNMRARGKRKRQKDPSRQVYRDILDKSDKVAENADVLGRMGVVLESGQAVSEDEAAAVAQAIGIEKPVPKPSNAGSGIRGSPKSPLIKVQLVDDFDDDEKVDLNEDPTADKDNREDEDAKLPQTGVHDETSREGKGTPESVVPATASNQ